MKISYNWLKWYVPEIPEPNRLADLFTYHICEVESVEKLEDGDHIFDLGILPNRAHDLLSHHGVARELSGLLGIKYNDPAPMYKTPISKPTNLKVEIRCLKLFSNNSLFVNPCFRIKSVFTPRFIYISSPPGLPLVATFSLSPFSNTSNCS